MNMMYTIMILLFMITMILTFLFMLMQNMNMFSNMSKSSFECGFNSKLKSQNTFSINYFFMTIIFLLFDLEILILSPMFLYKMLMNNILFVIFFFLIFTLILILEWKNGILEWT